MHNRFFKKMKYGAMFDRIMEEEDPDGQEDSSDVSSMLQSEEDEPQKAKKVRVQNASDDDSNSIKSVEENNQNLVRKGTRARELKRGTTFTKNQRRRQRKKEKK